MTKSQHIPRTTTELAKHFGLSRVTISYILNGRWRAEKISAKTADKVLDYVAKINFSPSPLGRALKGMIREDVAILFMPTWYEHQKRALFSLLQELEARDLSHSIHPFAEKRAQETLHHLKVYRVRRALVLGRSAQVDRAFWKSLVDETPEAKWLLYDFPFERFDDHDFGIENVSCVGVDRFDEERRVYRYILRCGYQRLIVPEYYFLTDMPSKRIAGEFNLELDPAWTYRGRRNEDQVLTSQQLECGLEIGRQLLELGKNGFPPRTAVFIRNDLASAAAIGALQEAGVRVPEDLGVMSWNGLDECAYYNVSLTTLKLPHDQMLERTLKWITADNPRKTVWVGQGKIVKGRSLQPPK